MPLPLSSVLSSSTSIPHTPQGRPLLDRKSTPHSQTPSLPATKGARRADNLTTEEPATATRPSRSKAREGKGTGKESQTRRTNPAQCATDYAKRAEDRSCAPSSSQPKDRTTTCRCTSTVDGGVIFITSAQPCPACALSAGDNPLRFRSNTHCSHRCTHTCCRHNPV